MPAAIGIRLVISIRSGGPSQPVAARNSAQRPQREVLAVDARADAPRRTLSRRRSSVELVGEVDRLDDRDERVQAVGARRADEQAQVDLARALAQALPQRAPVGGRERLGARVGGVAERDERLARAVADVRRGAGRQRERARERLAAVGEAVLDERAQARRRRRAVAAQADEHGVDVRHRVEHAARDLARRRARRTRAGRARTARRRRTCDGAAAKRSPTSFCTIATHVSTLSSSIVRRITVAATP